MDEKARQKEIQKQRNLRKKRLIIRNLSFKASEEDLKEIFSKYGKVLDVTIPLMGDNKKRGFAFVQFERFSSLIKAMKALNYTEVHGRPIAIDYAVDKTKYQEKMQEKGTEDDSSTLIKSEIKEENSEIESDSEVDKEISDSKNSESEIDSDEDISDSEKRVRNFFKEFDTGAENEEIRKTDSESSESDEGQSEEDTEDDQSEEDTEDDQSEEENSDSDEDQDIKKKLHKSDKLVQSSNRIKSNDVNEGKTVFLRNVSFLTTEEDLEDALAEYGEYEYCLMCMDKVTNHPKGTAFVKFKNKEDAEKLIKTASDDPGIFLDGRRLQCSFAISRDTIFKQNQEKETKQPKDKRNLHLLKVGVIMHNSEEAEGVSESDMKKRNKLDIMMKQKLKNLNFFISDKRLVIHNLPPHLKDLQLRKIFKQAAPPKAKITECRIMKDLQRVNVQGSAVSRGFGFVCFSQAEDALTALKKINNNPDIFTSQKRPIVEFSIESQMALQSKKRRKEKSQMNNKRKVEEARQSKNNSKILPSQTSAAASNIKNKRKRKKQNNDERQSKKSKNKFINSAVDSKPLHQVSSSEKKINQKKNKKNKKSSKAPNGDSLSDLFNKYKSRLINKMA